MLENYRYALGVYARYEALPISMREQLEKKFTDTLNILYCVRAGWVHPTDTGIRKVKNLEYEVEIAENALHKST